MIFTLELVKALEKVKEILSNATSMLNYAYITVQHTFGCTICQQSLWENGCHNVQLQGVSFPVCDNCYEQYYKIPKYRNNRKTKKRA